MNYLIQQFLKVINMGLGASFVVMVILLLRLLLKKTPKIYSYLLWIIVFFRFLCPFTIESMILPYTVNYDIISYNNLNTFSSNELMPNKNVSQRTNAEDSSTSPFMNPSSVKDSTLQTDNSKDSDISSKTGISSITASHVTNPFTYFKALINQMLPSYKTLSILSCLWFIGVIGILLLSLYKYIKLKEKLNTATLIPEKLYHNYRVYETVQVKSPILIGFLCPHIYMPIGLSNEEINYVISHEEVHIKRKDYLIKPLCLLAVAIHWFNPLAWLSFYLLSKDMEMSCDEAVILKSEEDIRINYSKSLLSLSMKQSGLYFPLAFGESNTKARVKNILHLKKPSPWAFFGALIIVFIAFVTLISNTDHERNKTAEDTQKNATQEAINFDSQMLDELSNNRTPYIGNNSKVIALVYTLPVPKGLEYKSIALQTKEEPYELNVYYNDEQEVNEETSRENADIAFENATLLFASIENMGKCNFHQDDKKTIITYKREDLETLFGELYPYSKSSDKMKELKDKIDAYLSGNYQTKE